MAAELGSLVDQYGLRPYHPTRPRKKILRHVEPSEGVCALHAHTPQTVPLNMLTALLVSAALISPPHILRQAITTAPLVTSTHPSDGEPEKSVAAPLLDWKFEFDEWLFRAVPSADLAVDQATRIVQTSNGGGPGILNWIGLDFITDIGGADGKTIGTLLLQPYVIHADGLPKTPPIFDGPHDWAMQWRFIQFDVTRWAHRGIGWKLGHFQVPFGLEHGINTTGTLRQFTNNSNLGVKADWGPSLYGERNGIDYEVAVTRGSGNEYRENDGNRVLAARVGNSLEENLCFGVSYMDAQLTGQDPPGMMTSFPKPTRTRWGADFRWRRATHTLLGETSYGKNDDDDVWASLLELNSSSNDERSLYYAQLVASGSKPSSGWQEREALQLGLRQHLSAHSTLSLQWAQDLEVPTGAEKSVIAVQLRFRF